MRKIINVALTAFGMSGEVFHGPLLATNPDFSIKKVLERNKSRSKEIYPQVEVVRNYDEILNDKNIGLIIITTPDHLHYETTKLALEAGKHVVVEKPFTIHSEEAEELINLARQKSLMLTVFHNRRLDGDFLTIKKVIDNKLLGRLVEFESHFDRYRNYIKPNTWKENPIGRQGCLHDLGSHMIDQALVLFGTPLSVTADLRIMRTGGQSFDHYDLRLNYNDIKVTLKCGYLVREQGPRYILHGTDGSFLQYGIDVQEDALKAGHTPLEANWGIVDEKFWGILNTELKGLHYTGHIETIAGCYQNFYKNIYEVLNENKELMVKPEEALQVIKVIDAALQSNSEKRTIPFR